LLFKVAVLICLHWDCVPVPASPHPSQVQVVENFFIIANLIGMYIIIILLFSLIVTEIEHF
jgi:hypothetical protein